MSRNFSDAELAAAARQLWGFAYKLTRDVSEAEDLIQDTAIRALEKQHLFAPGTNLAGWMHTIMRNMHASNVLRGWSRSRTLMPDMQITAKPTGDDRVQCREAMAAFRTLSPQHRQVLALHALGDDYGDIAARLGLPEGTVKSRINRARARMKRIAA